MIEKRGKMNMRYPFQGGIRSVLAVAMGFVMAFCLAACGNLRSQGGGDDENKEDPVVRALESDDLLSADGALVKNRKGEEVMLRGVNAGGLFVTENWMNGFASSGPTAEIDIRARDFWSISRVFIERFGLEETEKLWAAYQENWWSEVDFENCAAMGMNCIRLPFTYMTVDFDAVESYDNAGDYDFTPLDNFVEKAASYGIYTILDLHGAYGSQNGQDHSGQTFDSAWEVDFYKNSRMIGLTADLWRALADHYKDNPAVAGYDLLNEPGEKAGLTSETHFEVFDVLYDAVREKDKSHMVIFEACWDGKDLPRPEEYGWENCMYSFHHYTSLAEGGQFTEHGQSWNQKIEGVTSQNFGVPIHMGEFNNYNDPEQWTYVLDLLNREGWHWNSWTYKINNTWDNSAWGIYTIPAVNKVNPHTDSYETIVKKFEGLKTTEDIHKVDLDGRTLESIMKEYLTAPTQVPLEARGYIFFDAATNFPFYANGGAPILAPDRNAGQQITVSYHSAGDGTVYLGMAGGYFSVSGRDVRLGEKNTAARFYPVQTEYGYTFISYVTCRYLRLDGQGKLHADGASLDDCAIFTYEW